VGLPMQNALTIMLPAALSITMFSLGLGLTASDFAQVIRQPKAFAVGAFLQMLILPLCAVAIAALFQLSDIMALGLVILALCPGGPTSNIFSKFAGGDVALSVSLTAVITLLTVFTIPIFLNVAAGHYLGDSDIEVNVLSIAFTMLLTIIIPVLVGMLVRERAPQWTSRNEPRFIMLTGIIVAVLVGFALISNWAVFSANVTIVGQACIALLVAMVVAGLIAGKLLGLSAAQTTSISIDTAMQNGAMGITIATVVMSGNGGISPLAIPSGVYGLLMYFVCLPFVFWRRSLVKRV
jgi:bile acid:Na+ symporter, BASS family